MQNFVSFRMVTQSFSPAGGRSPFFARAIPTHMAKSVPTSFRYTSRFPTACLKSWLTTATDFPTPTSVMSEFRLPLSVTTLGSRGEKTRFNMR